MSKVSKLSTFIIIICLSNVRKNKTWPAGQNINTFSHLLINYVAIYKLLPHDHDDHDY